MYKLFAILVKLIPKYFVLFDAIVNGIIFLISFFDCSVFMLKHDCFLCVDFVSCDFAEFVC